MCLAYVYAACIVCVTIFSTSGKFRLVSNFTELDTLTQAARSYALLYNTSLLCVGVATFPGLAHSLLVVQNLYRIS